MVSVPENIKAIHSYEPGQTVEELQQQYKWDKYAVLWNNENTLGASKLALQSIKKELENSNFYPDPKARILCEKIATKWEVKSDNIVLGNGSEGLLMNIIRAFCRDGDELLTSEGSFVIIYNWARVNNVMCRSVPLRDDYSFDLNGILKSIHRQTKIIYLSNVNNPTGAMISCSELEDFLNKVPKEILVIVDEAYFEFSKHLNPAFPDSSKLKMDNVITIRTFSKAYGIAGNRLGFAIASEKIINTLYKVRLTFEPSNLSQAAGLGALDDNEFLSHTLKNNSRGLHHYYSEFESLGIKYVQSHGNFVMIVLPSPEQAQRVTQELLVKGVLVRHLGGTLSHCIRISVGQPEENQLCTAMLREITTAIS
ncbi:MAG: histidinol-phosphate transaminase [Bacteroidetes bacterium]|nr:histidinol-phosphate transaminase [Bacteroidota bacterium]MDA1119842.1 histidinol-phosphate transaminase [Bacteroidota bacterium]